MINNSDTTFEIIKNISMELFPGCRILLFGSRARKDHSNDSDYDFLIITKNNIEIRQKRTYKSLLRKKLANHKIPADILIQSENEVLIKEKITGHIVRKIIKEGILI